MHDRSFALESVTRFDAEAINAVEANDVIA